VNPLGFGLAASVVTHLLVEYGNHLLVHLMQITGLFADLLKEQLQPIWH
jgi:hypothetical protein